MPLRPRVIEFSYWLWVGACLVTMITAIVTLRSFEELKAMILAIVERQYPAETAVTREKVAAATVATVIGAGVLIAVVQLAFGLVMRSGRGWARFVLAGLTILGGLYSVAVFDTAPTISRAGILGSAALVVIALVLMFLPPARKWFADQC